MSYHVHTGPDAAEATAKATDVKRYYVYTGPDPRPPGSLAPRIRFWCECNCWVFEGTGYGSPLTCVSCGHKWSTRLCELEELPTFRGGAGGP